MKKFITIMFAAIVAIVAFSINANAQNWQAAQNWQTAQNLQNTQKGQWEITYRKADERTGRNACYRNLYIEGDNGCAIGHEVDATTVVIKTNKGIFDSCDDRVSVIIGFYKGDKLIEKVTTDFTVYGNPNTLLTWGYNTNGILPLEVKILDHIKYGGNVRIIAPKNNGEVFDLTIPMNPNVKFAH